MPSIQSKLNFVWKNWPLLAALAGLNFEVQFSMPYLIRFKSLIENQRVESYPKLLWDDFHWEF